PSARRPRRWRLCFGLLRRRSASIESIERTLHLGGRVGKMLLYPVHPLRVLPTARIENMQGVIGNSRESIEDTAQVRIETDSGRLALAGFHAPLFSSRPVLPDPDSWMHGARAAFAANLRRSSAIRWSSDLGRPRICRHAAPVQCHRVAMRKR